MRLIDADEIRIKPDFILYGVCGTPVIRCEDLARIINDMPTIEPQKWIPCSERLPKYEMDVLLQFTNNMCVGYFHPSDSWAIWSGGDWWTGILEGDEEPIAWMPLPKPYEENKE